MTVIFETHMGFWGFGVLGSIWRGAFGPESIWFWGAFGPGAFDREHLTGSICRGAFGWGASYPESAAYIYPTFQQYLLYHLFYFPKLKLNGRIQNLLLRLHHLVAAEVFVLIRPFLLFFISSQAKDQSSGGACTPKDLLKKKTEQKKSMKR